MNAGKFTESVVEEAALAWLAELGWTVAHGPEIAPETPGAERASYHEVILTGRLRAAIERLNPGGSQMGKAQALARAQESGAPGLMLANRAFHALLVNGVEVETVVNGEARGERLLLLDFDQPGNNDWLAVNQFTVIEGKIERRPDIVLFVNGLPLAVIELKNTADAKATIDTAFNQLQTYQKQIPRLFQTNALMMISDAAETKIGCIATPRERFAYWKTIDGELDPSGSFETALKGVFEHRRLLDLIESFIVFEDDGASVIKKIAQYHQFHAVRKAMTTALRASGDRGDGKGGVLWHTQGSGKSLSMLFFAGKLVREPALRNPTILMLTDRTDLDDQLFGTFSAGKELLRQTPVQAQSRAHLRELLTVNAGGVVFATIQKFFPSPGEEDYPELTDRRNVIVMADEAHRSQYTFKTKVGGAGTFVSGFAQHLRTAIPNATFVAFTGTPLELADKDTRIVFGNYIDIYDVSRAIADKATVPIYFESRLNKLGLSERETAQLDAGFEELTEDAEDAERQKLGSRWTQIEALVGTPKRLTQIAEDLLQHSDRRAEVISGKIMIVGMSRRICVDLYAQLAALRPEWANEEDGVGAMKVIMTGNATDPENYQEHIRNKDRRERLAERFKDPNDPFRVVIVRDMWLTGFDAPSLHTMYIDKPMKGHGLMQAIARVNRVFRDKPGGLVVDYIGLANNLKAALRAYMLPDGTTDKPIENESLDLGALISEMVNKLESCRAAFRGFSYDLFLTGAPSERLQSIAAAQQFLIMRDYNEKKGKVLDRFLDDATALQKAFTLASSTTEAQKIKFEFAFFQTVKAALMKTTGRGGGGSDEDLEHAIRQLVDRAIAPEGVVDIFAAAGLEKSDISILSDGFLAEIKAMPQRNLAVELLKKLLNDEIRAAKKTSVVQSRRFSERLLESLTRYHNRTLETAEIIKAMIELAKEMRAAAARGEELGLNDDEVAFYDALAENVSASAVMGDGQLLVIAQKVAETVRNNTTIDWQFREQARAKLRSQVKRVLRRYGYPPDKQESATLLVLEQAELFASEETTPLRRV